MSVSFIYSHIYNFLVPRTTTYRYSATVFRASIMGAVMTAVRIWNKSMMLFGLERRTLLEQQMALETFTCIRIVIQPYSAWRCGTHPMSLYLVL